MGAILLPDISKKINIIKKNPKILKKIKKGIEKEGLRINKKGKLSKNIHSKKFGKPITHKWITTDFSENMLEIITPVMTENNKIIYFLNDIHSYLIETINPELIWPFSIPCEFLKNEIQLAEYGKSKFGIKKKIYRKGLYKRYGALINMSTGIHYNFSLPKKLLNIWKRQHKIITNNSEGYLQIIRNYLRYGWLIPYIFGASPSIPKKFLKTEQINLSNFQEKYDMAFLPWATSLRIGNALTNKNIITNHFDVKFNTLNEYINDIQKALNTSCKKFEKIGLIDKNENLQQINTNFLQLESEFYTQIRPKINTKKEQTMLENLSKNGIEYIEIRSLDLNPFSPIGINKTQILFLDIFLIWCFISDSPEISSEELKYIYKNWKTISLKGRKPNLKIENFKKKNKISFKKKIKKIYVELFKISNIFDQCFQNNDYTNACKKIKYSLYNSNLTYSKNIMNLFLKNKSMKKTGIKLSKTNKKFLENKKFTILNKEIIENIKKKSIQEYKKIIKR